MILLILAFFFLILSSIFSGSEIAFFSLPKNQISKNTSTHKKYSFFMSNEYSFLLMLLISNMVVNVGFTSIGESFFNKYLNTFEVVSLISIVLLIFGEVIPKSIAVNNSKIVIDWSFVVLKMFYYFLYPILKLFNFFEVFFRNISQIILPLSKEKIDFNKVIKIASKELELAPFKEHFIKKFYFYNKYIAKNFMKLLENSIFLSGDEDDVYLKLKEEFDIITQKNFVVISQFVKLQKILSLYSKNGKKFFFVIDEYGIVIGYFSFADFLGQIKFSMKAKNDFFRSIVLKGSEKIKDINDDMYLNIPISEQYSTLNGFLLSAFQKIPEKNEKIELNKYIFKVLSVNKTKILDVEITNRGS